VSLALPERKQFVLGCVIGTKSLSSSVAAMNARPQQRDLEDSDFLEARRVSGATLRKVGDGVAGAAGFAGA
jgi:hypothetical protein